MGVVSIGLLEDDLPQAELLIAWLTEAGYKVFCRDTGKDFLLCVRESSPDLLILDWQLPDCEGIDILDTLRNSDSFLGPVMFATARDAEKDIVAGLEAGADDYLVKPLRKAELLARLAALLRRVSTDSPTICVLGDIELDLENQRARVRGENVSLTSTEFQLAYCVFSNVGKLLSREFLLKEVWGVNATLDTRTVDMHISRIRKLLKIGPQSGYCIQTVYRHGYRLEAL